MFWVRFLPACQLLYRLFFWWFWYSRRQQMLEITIRNSHLHIIRKCRLIRSLIDIVNKNPTRCNSMQIFIYRKVTLHVSGVTAPIIRSTKNCNRNLRYSYFAPTWPAVLWPEPEVTVTVFSTPDDGCCDTRNMYSDFAVNKYLHTVASGWIFINIELRCTEPWVKKNLINIFIRKIFTCSTEMHNSNVYRRRPT